MTDDRYLLRRKEAARMLGGDAQLQRLIRSGALRVYKLDTGERRFLHCDVVAVQESRMQRRKKRPAIFTNAELRKRAGQEHLVSTKRR